MNFQYSFASIRFNNPIYFKDSDLDILLCTISLSLRNVTQYISGGYSKYKYWNPFQSYPFEIWMLLQWAYVSIAGIVTKNILDFRLEISLEEYCVFCIHTTYNIRMLTWRPVAGSCMHEALHANFSNMQHTFQPYKYIYYIKLDAGAIPNSWHNH